MSTPRLFSAANEALATLLRLVSCRCLCCPCDCSLHFPARPLLVRAFGPQFTARSAASLVSIRLGNMSWQSNWGTVKATNAKAAALYYEVANVGKTIESSKKRVVWRLKVEEGREFEITLTHSLASGKKVLRVDSIVKYTSQSVSAIPFHLFVVLCFCL
jgi:hypothetical protein